MIWWISTFIIILVQNSPIPSPAVVMKQSWRIFDIPLRLFGGRSFQKAIAQPVLNTGHQKNANAYNHSPPKIQASLLKSVDCKCIFLL